MNRFHDVDAPRKWAPIRVFTVSPCTVFAQTATAAPLALAANVGRDVSAAKSRILTGLTQLEVLAAHRSPNSACELSCHRARKLPAPSALTASGQPLAIAVPVLGDCPAFQVIGTTVPSTPQRVITVPSPKPAAQTPSQFSDLSLVATLHALLLT